MSLELIPEGSIGGDERHRVLESPGSDPMRVRVPPPREAPAKTGTGSGPLPPHHQDPTRVGDSLADAGRSRGIQHGTVAQHLSPVGKLNHRLGLRASWARVAAVTNMWAASTTRPFIKASSAAAVTSRKAASSFPACFTPRPSFARRPEPLSCRNRIGRRCQARLKSPSATPGRWAAP